MCAAFGIVPQDGLLDGSGLELQTQHIPVQHLTSACRSGCQRRSQKTGPTHWCVLFLVAWKSVDLQCQGEDLSATHRVQSHRGVIERQFALLKNWQGLFGGLLEAFLDHGRSMACRGLAGKVAISARCAGQPVLIQSNGVRSRFLFLNVYTFMVF